MIFTMLKMLLSIIFGIIYLPLNLLLLKVSELYQGMSKRDPLYWLIRIGIFPLWAVVSILSAPYEILVESAH
jgi:hypothetical protein